MSEPQMTIYGGNRRGRPKSDKPKTSLTAWVPQTHADRLAQLALKHDISVSKVVCQLLDQALRKKTP